ncbi:MAG: hypothetical protein JWO11_4147 [Nocardioides sp.]|nr:hypothetical protein [Nocardioides sp.]
MACLLFHAWQTIDITGRVHTQRCKHCPKTRIRVTGPKNDSRD